MTPEEAKEILKDAITKDVLANADSRIWWDRSYAFLENIFTADELEAIAIYMRAHKK